MTDPIGVSRQSGQYWVRHLQGRTMRHRPDMGLGQTQTRSVPMTRLLGWLSAFEAPGTAFAGRWSPAATYINGIRCDEHDHGGRVTRDGGFRPKISLLIWPSPLAITRSPSSPATTFPAGEVDGVTPDRRVQRRGAQRQWFGGRVLH